MQVTMATTLKIHLFKNDDWKKGQYTSLGSGACSVIHSVGFSDCFNFKATAAPYRDLKDTKADRTCFTIIVTPKKKQ